MEMTREEYINYIINVFYTDTKGNQFKPKLAEALLCAYSLEELNAISIVSPSWYNAGLNMYTLLSVIDYLIRGNYSAKNASICLKEMIVKLQTRKKRGM